MARRNLAGGYGGESRVVTVRLTPADTRTLRDLAEAWQVTPSEVLRQALRQAAEREPGPGTDSKL